MAAGFSGTLEGGHDAEYDYCCTPCADDNLNAEALFYCRNCSKLFCDACVKFHDKIHKGHHIFGRKEVTKWGKVKSEIHSLMCEEHPDKEEEVYCADHDLTCCHICTNVYHRACKEVKHVSEVAKGIQKTPEFQSFLTNAASTQTRLRDKQDKKVKNTKLLQKTSNEIMSTFKDIRNSLNQFMDNVEKESTTETDRLLSILQTKIQSDTNTCLDFEKEIQKFLDNINKYGNQCNEFAFQCFKKCMRKVSSAEELLSSMKDEDYQLKFTQDASIKQFQSALQTFGKFEITPMNFPSDHVYTVSKIQTYNIRTKIDTRECNVSGMCQLSDGQVAIVDCNNNKVKLLCSSEYSIIDELKFPEYPHDICPTTGTELVVTVSIWFPNRRSELHFISAADGHLTHTRTKGLDHECFGVACHNGQLYVGSSTALFEYSLSGKKLRKIYEGDTTVRRFAFRDDGNRIYITNFSQGCLLTLDKSGQKLSVLSNPELQTPRGICLADNSTVFVCESDSHTVIQVNSEGEKKMATLAKQSDGVNNPMSLCFDRKLQQLLLGQGKCDNLLLLKVKCNTSQNILEPYT